jgi:hypothetical protein
MILPKKTSEEKSKPVIVEEKPSTIIVQEEPETFDLPEKTEVVETGNRTNITTRTNHRTDVQPQVSSSDMMEPGENLVKNTNDSWINNKWRPAMGWMYMVVCIFDFILFPILWAVVQFWEVMPENDAFRQWSPLTLQGAGLFHMAMGAVLGITAYGRSKEKIESKN